MRIRLPVLFISLALLTSCQGKQESQKTVVAKKAENTAHILTPRAVELSAKHLLEKSYLRDVLPESAYIYARVPNFWSLLGGAVGNVFDKALASKPYEKAISSIKEGFSKEVIPELPKDARAFVALLLGHTTSPIEVIAMTPAVEEKSPFPNVLLSVAVDFKDIASLNQLLKIFAAKASALTIEKEIQADGIGEIKIDGLKVQLKFDLAAHRLFVLGGMKLQDNSLSETLKLLKPNTAHAMKSLESDIDSSGQGLFAWINPQRVLALAGAAGAQKEIAPLAMVGVNSMRNIAIGMGTAKGINRFKFVIDMPKTGFRGFIPTVQHSPSFKLAGKTDFIVTLGLPSKADFVSIESSSGAMASSTKMQGYYDFKKAFSEKVGIEIEDIFAILGQDINFASDESGVYTALRLKDEKKFNEVLAKLVKTFDLKHETRTISGQEYHHLLLSTFQSVMAKEIEASSLANDPDNGRLLMRFLNIPSHLYWQQEDGYLIMASVPQVLMDRHYASPQISAAEWYEKEQRIDPKGALFMATMRNKGVPASMYRARLAVLAYLGDAVGRPVDLFSLPTVREANLPKEGAFGVKLTSAEDQLALEFAFESNPAEVLFAGNAYAGVMMTGVLASIAIPAYEDYLIRAKVNMGLAAATRLKNELQLFKLENNHYPTIEEASNLNQKKWSNKDYQLSIDLGTGDIIVRFNHKRLTHDLVLVKPEGSEAKWKCETDIPRKFLSSMCK